jgi:HEPN domain-containing protein
LEGPSPILDAACFHCQQAAEKSLKAFLVWNEREPPRTHALGLLLDAGLACEARLEEHRAHCERLTAYAVEIRYPDSAAEPTPEKAVAAFEAAEALVSFILGIVPPQVRH